MISRTLTFPNRARAIAELDAQNAPISRALRAALDEPSLANNPGAAGGGILMMSTNEIARPDGGVAIQIIVQQHAASMEFPSPDLQGGGASS